MNAAEADLNRTVARVPSCRNVFSTELGWMAMAGTGNALGRLVFGYPTAADAERALGPRWLEASRFTAWNCPLQRRLQRYAAGQTVEFDDVLVDLLPFAGRMNRGQPTGGRKHGEIGWPGGVFPGQVSRTPLTDFARRVMQALRRVRYGQVTTYGALAAEAGSPKASRAVGNLMAANAVPLVLPCHRVLCASHRIGNYSAPGGTATKRFLLDFESRRCKCSRVGNRPGARPWQEISRNALASGSCFNASKPGLAPCG